jgi:hypothetical protein
MNKDEALRLALEALESIFASTHPYREDGTCTINDKSVELSNKAIASIEEALEAKEKPAVNSKDTALRIAIESLCCVRDMVGHPDNLEYIDHQIAKIEAALEAKDEPYGFEASIYSNARMKVDVVTGNVSIGTVKKPCGLECDCTNVCKQDDYKALWQQMCERCDELDKKLAQLEAKDEPVATDWERIARVQNAKLMAMLDEAGGFEKLCEVMDKYEALSPTPPQRKPLTDEEMKTVVEQELVNYWDGEYIDTTGARDCLTNFARAIESAHAIKGEA